MYDKKRGLGDKGPKRDGSFEGGWGQEEVLYIVKFYKDRDSISVQS